jgi:mRNA interferase YafQ
LASDVLPPVWSGKVKRDVKRA